MELSSLLRAQVSMMDKIAKAQERFDLLDRIPIGVCVLQADYTILFWNGCLEEWTKISRDRILGRYITDYFEHLNQPQYVIRLQQIFEGGPPEIFSSQLHKHLFTSPLPNGQLRIHHTTVTAVPAGDNVGFNALFSIQDVTDLTHRIQDYRGMRDRALAEVTERLQVEEVLRQHIEMLDLAKAEIRNALAQEKELNQLKSRFISVTSHEFRTPLTTILMAAESLEHYGHSLPENKRKLYLNYIQNNVRRMTDLLNDVLLIAKVDAGKLEFKPNPLDLVAFCRELTEEIQLVAGRQYRIEFASPTTEKNATSDIGIVCMDEKLLRHILLNLLSNAIKYSPENSAVYFELSFQEDLAVFKIKDWGIGIPPQDQKRLFETFHRAENVGTIPGTGLGLTIVEKSVDLHGGSITFDSVAGKGTMFTVVLPCQERQENPAEEN